MTALFPPELLAALQGLRVEARRVPRGGRHAEHHAREAGAGIEFRDYRAYVPGDDMRRVDWSLYRRFERLFLRLLDEVRDLPLYVLVDLSDSMWFESVPGHSPAFSARQAAGIASAIALQQLDPVGVFPFGEKLGRFLPPVHGKRNLPRVLSFLIEQEKLGPTDFQASLRGFQQLALRPGLLMVISDFFDDRGLDAVLAGLGALRHRLLIVRTVRATDRNPALHGELRLRDCETGTPLDLTVTDAILEKYHDAWREFEESLKGFARKRGAGYLDLSIEEPVLAQFQTLFPGGVFEPRSV